MPWILLTTTLPLTSSITVWSYLENDNYLINFLLSFPQTHTYDICDATNKHAQCTIYVWKRRNITKLDLELLTLAKNSSILDSNIIILGKIVCHLAHTYTVCGTHILIVMLIDEWAGEQQCNHISLMWSQYANRHLLPCVIYTLPWACLHTFLLLYNIENLHFHERVFGNSSLYSVINSWANSLKIAIGLAMKINSIKMVQLEHIANAWWLLWTILIQSLNQISNSFVKVCSMCHDEKFGI